MAGEEDVELRDLVAQTLETKGVLGRIRAQLRASVFLALEEQELEKKPHPLASSKLAEFLKTKDGKVATALVREFLEFFELDYTCAVFDPESNALESYPGREKLAQDLGIDTQVSTPLLASVLQKSRHSPPAASVVKVLKFPEQATDSSRNSNSTHPPNRRPFEDSQPPLTQGKLGPLRDNDITYKNSTLTPSLQPPTNALNTNENSNLHPEVTPEDLKSPIVTQNGLDSEKPQDLVDLSMGSVNGRRALGETGNKSMDILNSTENIDKVAELAGVTSGSGRDELDDFFDNALLSKSKEHSETNSHISEDLSTPMSSMTAGKFETEDLTLSQNSLPDDFDYTEQVQS